MRPEHPAKASSGRTGRHEPIRSTTSRIAARGAGLGLTMAAGMAFIGAFIERRRMTRVARAAADLAVKLVADGTRDDEVAARLPALPGADRVALEQAARRTAGNPETGRALGLLGRVAVLRALL
jgi:hypothetical protein